MHDLLTLPGDENSNAWSISDAGEVVGESFTYMMSHNPFKYSEGMMQNLEMGSGQGGTARSINNAGQSVGVILFAGRNHAVRWHNGSLTDLQTLAGFTQSAAMNINDLGQIVGESFSVGPFTGHAFLWLPEPAYGLAEGMNDLRAFPGADISSAHGSNSLGQVVGAAETTGGQMHAFLWLPVPDYNLPQGMNDLGTLGGTKSFASAINDSGQIVGWSTTADGYTHAFLCRGDEMIDLNTLISPSSGWVLGVATAINEAGQIVGYGSYNGHLRAFLLNPKLVTVIVHGYQMSGEVPQWAYDMRNAIYERTAGAQQGAGVIVFNWADASNDFIPRLSLHDDKRANVRLLEMAEELARLLVERGLVTADPDCHVHLIGHSRGGSLVSYTAALLKGRFRRCVVDHMTILDGFDDTCGFFGGYLKDPTICGDNANWMDNYYQTRDCGFLDPGLCGRSRPDADLDDDWGVRFESTHTTIHTHYITHTIDDVNNPNGYYWSLGGGHWDERPTRETSPCETVIVPVLNGDFETQDLLIWSVLEGNPVVVPDGNDNYVCSMEEESSVGISQEIMTPVDAHFLTFDFAFTTRGDGDSLSVSLDGITVFSFLGTDFDGDGLVGSGQIDISAFAQRISCELVFRLNSVGAPGASVLLDNIKVVSETGVVFVDADAPGSNDGSSWGNAYNNLQDALAAGKPGDEIWVAQGTYKPGGNRAAFQLVNNVAIRGGYAGFGERNPYARNVQTYEAVLSGDIRGDDGPNFTNRYDNSYHVVTGSATNATAILDGFSIIGGNAKGDIWTHEENGGGIYIENGSPTLIDCTFTDNFAIYGGAMYTRNSRATLTRCTFTGNHAAYGGAIENYASYPTIANSTFIGNSSSYFGGAIHNRDSTGLAVAGCTFVENRAGQIGGGSMQLR